MPISTSSKFLMKPPASYIHFYLLMCRLAVLYNIVNKKVLYSVHDLNCVGTCPSLTASVYRLNR